MRRQLPKARRHHPPDFVQSGGIRKLECEAPAAAGASVVARQLYRQSF
jgi:hypothetical protein